jgi:MFS transporter, UMF1 family
MQNIMTNTTIQINQRKSITAISAWCLYDWASASFSIIVMTFIFATYFKSKVAENEIVGTYQWANATSIAGIIIAFTSPLFGAIADHNGHHKRWLLFFTGMCILSSGLLWFSYPSVSSVPLTLICLVCGSVGLEVALVFYNSFLSQLAPKDYLGRISGWGWGCGYIGGILALTFALIFFIKTNIFS